MDIKDHSRLFSSFLFCLSVCLSTSLPPAILPYPRRNLRYYTTLRYHLLPRNDERTWEAARALLVVVERVLAGGVRVGRAGYVLSACCVVFVVVDGADGGVCGVALDGRDGWMGLMGQGRKGLVLFGSGGLGVSFLLG